MPLIACAEEAGNDAIHFTAIETRCLLLPSAVVPALDGIGC